MLRRTITSLALTAVAVIPGSANAPMRSASVLPPLTGTVRIMEAGDSTAAGIGASCTNGDRIALNDWLTIASIKAQFVGSMSYGCTAAVAANEGHAGQSTAWLADNIAGFLAANPADVVIVSVGINDMKDPRYMTAEQTLVDYTRLVTNIRAAAPSTRILATELFVPNGSKGGNFARASIEAQRFNALLAATMAPFGDWVRVARTGIISTKWSNDGLHLNDTGYVQRAWIFLHDPQALGPWLSDKPLPQADSYFDVLPYTS